MPVNQVYKATGEKIIDISDSTVTADKLLQGETAYLANGAPVVGTFVPVTGVKGDAESTYRTGNVNITPANIGAAASADFVAMTQAEYDALVEKTAPLYFIKE